MGVQRNGPPPDARYRDLHDGPLAPVLGDDPDGRAFAEPKRQESTSKGPRAVIELQIAGAFPAFRESERVAGAPFPGIADNCGAGSGERVHQFDLTAAPKPGLLSFAITHNNSGGHGYRDATSCGFSRKPLLR